MNRRTITVDMNGIKAQAVEIGFEPVTEPWAEYALLDGGRVRHRSTALRMYQLVDDDGHLRFDENGDPVIFVQAHAVSTAKA